MEPPEEKPVVEMVEAVVEEAVVEEAVGSR